MYMRETDRMFMSETDDCRPTEGIECYMHETDDCRPTKGIQCICVKQTIADLPKE